jgi:hypothetical protein
MILGMACSSTEQFDRQVWQSAPDHRYYMIDDLISGKRLVGMSKAEVIHALDTTDIKQFSLPGNCWMYIIGKPGWVPATDSPVIVFDVTFRNGRVVTVEKRK